MSLNYKEINVILEELALGGSRIDKINQPDRFSLYLETYGNKRKQKILISLTHGAVRIHRIHLKPEFPPTPPRFTQLLRARIKGGRIISLSQPENERILQFIIQTQDKIQHLWCRLWSGNPNLILTDENFVIIDTLFRKRGINEFAGEIFNPDFSLLKKNNKKIITVRTNNSHENFNDFINNYYSKENESNQFSVLKEKELKNLNFNISKITNHIGQLQERQIKYTDSNRLKEYGALILANLHNIKKGDQEFVNEEKTIPLKPECTPLENSHEYFNKYKKQTHGLELVKAEIAQYSDQIKELEIIKENLSQTENLDQLKPFITKEKNFKKQIEKNKIGLTFQSGDFKILAGRNSKENDQLLRKKARGNDMWLHVRDFPGGFIFIKSVKGKSIPLEVLLDGANLALLYSAKKYKDKADIHYTEVKNLRRVKGGKEGLVLANNEKNLFIQYDENRIKRLQKKISLLETIPVKIDN